MENEVMLTTFDNPFDPFDEFIPWFLFDVEKGYYTCSRLARIARYSEDFSTIEDKMETERVEKWQIDSIGRFFSNRTVMIDGKPAADVFKKNGAKMTAADSTSYGFYYKQIKAPTNTDKFAKDTTVYINYVGKLLNGLVFDTNVERVAKDNGLYSASRTYEPTRINWGENYEDITMGSDKSSIISGFAQTLWQMKDMEKGIGVFISSIGYGYSGSGSSIPAYAPLIFEIELVAKPEE